MRTSCIQHKPNDNLVMIRESYVKAFGDFRIAALISFFEYWHTIKLDIVKKNKQYNDNAEKHGDDRKFDETLLQWHTYEEIHENLFGIIGINALPKYIKTLEDLEIISIHKNPNPRYAFDRTNYYLFNPEKVQEILTNTTDSGNPEERKVVTVATNCCDGDHEKLPAITEITTEITTENLKETEAVSFPHKMDFVENIIEIFADTYYRYKQIKYIKSAKDRSAVGKLLRVYRRENPRKTSEEALMDFKRFFEQCMQIKDKWYADNISLPIINSKINEIRSIIRGYKNGKESSVSDQELARIVYQ